MNSIQNLSQFPKFRDLKKSQESFNENFEKSVFRKPSLEAHGELLKIQEAVKDNSPKSLHFDKEGVSAFDSEIMKVPERLNAVKQYLGHFFNHLDQFLTKELEYNGTSPNEISEIADRMDDDLNIIDGSVVVGEEDELVESVDDIGKLSFISNTVKHLNNESSKSLAKIINQSLGLFVRARELSQAIITQFGGSMSNDLFPKIIEIRKAMLPEQDKN